MSVIPHPTKHRSQEGKTWWYIDVGRGFKRKRIPYEGSFADASKVEKGLQASGQKQTETSFIAIKELILPFLDWYKNEVAATTLEDINDTITLYVVPHFGNLRPAQLTIPLINDFKTTLLNQGLKPTTINKHLNYFSSILKWAIAFDHCQPLTFAIPRFPKKKTQSAQIKPLTKRQVDALYRHIRPQYRMTFLLMADMGLRASEAMNMKVDDINEANKCITVLGKGSKYRTVPYMSDRFEGELDNILDTKLDGYLVVNPKTEKPYVTIRKELERAVKLAGLSRKVNHHLLRHTFSSLAAEGGISPYVLQKLLGHSSIETTMKIYTHISKNYIGDEVLKFRENKKLSR